MLSSIMDLLLHVDAEAGPDQVFGLNVILLLHEVECLLQVLLQIDDVVVHFGQGLIELLAMDLQLLVLSLEL